MAKRVSPVDSTISADIVGFLRQQGLTYRKIGELAGVSESYICRVAKGKKNLTITHLTRFEQQLGRPLPILLLEATPRESLPEEMRELYDQVKKLLQKNHRLRLELNKTEE